MASTVHRIRTVALCLILVIIGCMLPEIAVAAGLLKQGMAGRDVKELQQKLIEWGYRLEADGKFGPMTVAAVKAFQESRGLKVDGIVGVQTWEEIENGSTLTHTVKRGDSLYTLARRYGVSIEAVMDANDLTDEIIIIGRELTIPIGQHIAGGGQGVSGELPPEQVYQVRPGDSASVIARKFNTSVPALAEANRLADPNRLRAGQKLVIPGWRGNMPRFIWPVRGRLSSPYGWRVHPVYRNRQFHGGIDIAVPVGTSVRAVAAGKVIRSGYMGAFGYGVVIDHGRGVTTWYGHNSRLSVKVGEKVRQGQVIARSGNSGVTTGPHVDFRIKVDGETVNPVQWLP